MDWKEEFKKTMLGPNIEIDKIDSGFFLKFCNIPKKLFKYREFDINGNSIKNLVSNTVWMNSPENFNDPYDCALTINLNKEQCSTSSIIALYEHLGITKEVQDRELPRLLESENPIISAIKFLTTEKVINEQIASKLTSVLEDRDEQLIRHFSDNAKMLTKVCSFSESEDSTLMWAHYANYHSGFCIEYDFTALGPNSLTTRFLYPVFYSDLLHDHSDLMPGIDINKANPLSIVMPALTKAKDWSYEREWRLVFSNNFMKTPQTCSVPKASRVYAGVKISPKNLEKLAMACTALKIPLVRMKMSNTSFSITADISNQ